MKKVSVIIPTYKRSDNLIRAIESVINQTYKNIEIIVVDDNDENSEFRKVNEKKLKKFVETKKIIYLKHKQNKNGAAARNTGLNRCTGDFITFLDDDDYYLNTRIEKLVDLLEKNKKYSCAYSSAAISLNNKIISIIEAEKSGNMMLDVLKQNSFFGTGSNMFFTRDAIDKTGLFDENFIRHQDMEYMVRFFKNGLVIPYKEILVIKCVDDKSNIPNYDKMIETKKMYLKKFEKEIQHYNNNEKNDIYYQNYYELLKLYPEKKKELINVIKGYHKISLYDKLIFFLKKIKNKNKIINKIINIIKIRKYKRYQYLIIKDSDMDERR